MPIRFFAEGHDFKLCHPRKTSTWIKKIINKERYHPGEVNYIFCTDAYLLSINQQYLRHNSLTDIITFDYSLEGEGKLISGDIYISTERVEENANTFARPFDEELHRVIIHGILHLLGYSDKTGLDKVLMRKKEEACLSLRH